MPGLVTNRELLARVLSHPAFVAGDLHTHFLAEHAGELGARPPGLDRLRVAALAATLHGILARAHAEPLAPTAWRNVPFADQRVTYKLGDAEIQITYRDAGGGALVFEIGGKPTPVARYGRDGDHLWFVEHGGHLRRARVTSAAGKTWVLSEGLLLALVEEPRFAETGVALAAGALVAPMPGKVVKVLASVGQEVAAGAPLVVLEAMKMEHTVRAAAAGIVRALHVVVGDQVDGDRLLAVVTAA